MNTCSNNADICTHLGEDPTQHLGAIVPPIFQNTLFTRKTKDHGYTYSKISNPTIELLEQKLAALEHAQSAKVFASGMGAITATLSSALMKGDHVIALRSCYLPTKIFLEKEMGKFGVETSLIDNFSIEEIEKNMKSNTRVFFMESPSSFIFKIIDLQEIAQYAKKHHIITIIDNTWATPIYQNPLDFGIDYVVHSATKYIGGHSDVTAGVVMGSKDKLDQLNSFQRSCWGACLDPFAAWLLIRSLRTLEIRMAQHGKNALKVAQFLESHEKVSRVYYPGLPSHDNYDIAAKQMSGYSGLLSFVVKKNKDELLKALKSLKLFEEGPSWGGFESIFNTPGLAEDDILLAGNIPKGLIRISVGLENVDSIIEDLNFALKSL